MISVIHAALLASATALRLMSTAQASSLPTQPIGILLAAGDIAKCNPESGRDEATAAVLATAIADARARNIPVRVLALGDLAYDHGTSSEFDCFNQSWGAHKSLMLPVPGNHDYGDPPAGQAAPFFRYFSANPLPPEGAVVTANGANAGYYAVNFPDPQAGPWRIIGLNPYTRAAGGTARQWEWLRQDLANNGAPCIIAFAHPFLLSSGHHGHRDGASSAPVIGSSMVTPFRLLYQARASVLLQAHDHNFEQFGRHDASGRRDPHGVRSFVVGTGGGRLYVTAQTSRWPSSEAYEDRSFGVLKIDLYPGHYEWRFLPIEGGSPPVLPVRSDQCNRRR